MTNEQCPPHHWIIDDFNVGRCKKCPAVKDFGALMSKDRNFAEIVHPKHSKRGKRRKQAAREVCNGSRKG